MTTAQQSRDQGITQAANHAEATSPGWRDIAWNFLLSFAERNETFISEDVSGASKDAGLPQPPTDRAWGSIYVKAARLGYIVQYGSGRSQRRHASICPRWRSNLFAA